MRRLLHLLRDLAVSLSTVGACVLAFRFGVMTLLANSLALSDLQLTSVRRIGVTASLLAAYWAVARLYERRAVTELAVAPVAISVSAFFGIILIGTTILSLYALGAYELLAFRGIAPGLPIIGIIFLSVVFEEVVFRGIVFRLLEQYLGTVTALICQALVFGVLHLLNTGSSPVTGISVTLLGALWAVIYAHTRNLWAVVAHHAAWNLTIFGSGLPLSGQEAWRSSAPLEGTYEGPVWLTGGAFGPEDSILNLLVVASALGMLAHRAWRKGSFRGGSSPPTA